MHPYEDLFNQYKPLAYRVQFLAGIVQNDAGYPPEALVDWAKEFQHVQDDLQALKMATWAELQKHNHLLPPA